MSLFSRLGRRKSAPVARDRLQILLAHERSMAGGSDLAAILRDEVLAVVRKHVAVEPENIQIKLERGAAVSTLEVDIAIQAPKGVDLGVAGAALAATG